MGGVEVLLATVVLIFGMVGLVRGLARELGVTMALVVLLAVMAQFDNMVAVTEMPAKVNAMVSGLGLGSEDPQQQRMMALFFYSAAVILTAFLAYHGQETLKFNISVPGGIVGAVLGWLVGSLNGYLMFGTIWHYMDKLEYPMQKYAWFQLPLTSLGEQLLKYLPQEVAGGMVLSALALVLLWWRILK